MMPLITVITSTIGNKRLRHCIQSVRDQSYPEVQHLIIVDNRIDYGCTQLTNTSEARADGYAYQGYERSIIELPYSTGADRFNGHRNLAAGIYLAKGEWIAFLDDDNTFCPQHLDRLMKAIEQHKAHWAYSLRDIVDQRGVFLCHDNCESLGQWPSVINDQDYFVDVNCFLLPRQLALALSPLMYRKFREPGQMEIDRAMTWALRKMGTRYAGTGEFTVNYAMGGSELSVQPEFFVQGNKAMEAKYGTVLPWRQSVVSDLSRPLDQAAPKITIVQ